MLFNSIHFIFFFTATTFTYFIAPHKSRWFLLLVASCYFYMAFIPVYILILGFTIIVDYFAGIYIERVQGKKRKYFLIASIFANVGILAIFKYYNFLNNNLSVFLNHIGYMNHIPNLSMLLPIGLSFHTFQAMSYTIEVYRGHQKAEKHFGIYALYVMFYPQLVAGPIERPQNMLHQFHEKHIFDYMRIVNGLKQMVWGFFKKIVIADRLALYVNAIYNNADQHNGITLLVATIFFAFQIYCDFSGYSDIAVGAAQVLGFKLMMNFNRPYFSKNISEFWKRWHISLSSWFRDYLYISIGGNRVSVPRWYFNLLFVFLISGFWHGANWTFIIWGGLNGLYLVFGIIIAPLRKRATRIFQLNKFSTIQSIIQIVITFSLTCIAWVFFRANSLKDALMIIKKIFFVSGKLFLGVPKDHFFYSVLAIIVLLCIETKREYFPRRILLFHNNNWYVRRLSYACIIVMILLFGVFDGGQFIYFQF